MESYREFYGLNTVDSNNTMLDSEMVDLVNIDLRERGSIRRRSGIVHHLRSPIWADITGKTWGEL